MADVQVPDWRALSEILAALEGMRHSFPVEGELEEALVNAMCSGEVPLRARPADRDYDLRLRRPVSAFKRIEAYVGPDTTIKLSAAFISIQRGIMTGPNLRAEADLRAVR